MRLIGFLQFCRCSGEDEHEDIHLFWHTTWIKFEKLFPGDTQKVGKISFFNFQRSHLVGNVNLGIEGNVLKVSRLKKNKACDNKVSLAA